MTTVEERSNFVMKTTFKMICIICRIKQNNSSTICFNVLPRYSLSANFVTVQSLNRENFVLLSKSIINKLTNA